MIYNDSIYICRLRKVSTATSLVHGELLCLVSTGTRGFDSHVVTSNWLQYLLEVDTSWFSMVFQCQRELKSDLKP